MLLASIGNLLLRFVSTINISRQHFNTVVRVFQNVFIIHSTALHQYFHQYLSAFSKRDNILFLNTSNNNALNAEPAILMTLKFCI